MKELSMRTLAIALVLMTAGIAAADTSVRDTCIEAVSKDPQLARDVADAALGVDVAAKKRAAMDAEAGERRADQDAQQRDQTARQVALDQRQVILAYAAMWVVAALFVIFLWRKQQALKAEIAGLKRDLDEAAKK